MTESAVFPAQSSHVQLMPARAPVQITTALSMKLERRVGTGCAGSMQWGMVEPLSPPVRRSLDGVDIDRTQLGYYAAASQFPSSETVKSPTSPHASPTPFSEASNRMID